MCRERVGLGVWGGTGWRMHRPVQVRTGEGRLGVWGGGGWEGEGRTGWRMRTPRWASSGKDGRG